MSKPPVFRGSGVSLGGFLGEALGVFNFLLSFKCPDPENGHRDQNIPAKYRFTLQRAQLILMVGVVESCEVFL